MKNSAEELIVLPALITMADAIKNMSGQMADLAHEEIMREEEAYAFRIELRRRFRELGEEIAHLTQRLPENTEVPFDNRARK